MPRKPRRNGFRCSGVGRSGKGVSTRFRSSSRPVQRFEQKHRTRKLPTLWRTISWLRRSGTLAHPEQALLCSQQGPMAGLLFSLLLSAETTFQSQEFRVLFFRRFWQPLHLCSFTCRCGRPFDSRGHHRAACPFAGVLRRREAGGRVTTNVRVQDLDLLPLRQVDNRQAGSPRRWLPPV